MRAGTRALTLAAWLASAAASAPVAQSTQELFGLLVRAGLHGDVKASCRGGFRPGHDGEFALALADGAGGGRYLVVQDDGGVHELATYAGQPDLSCYTVAEADRLTASIARSDTINGRVTAEWDGLAVCGFIEATIAVCWQFAPEQRRFVRIGGWTT
jgi:hypothetical protein